MRRLSTRRDGLVLLVVLGRRAAAAPCAAALLLLRLLLVGLPRLPLPSNLACLGLDQRFGSVSRLVGGCCSASVLPSLLPSLLPSVLPSERRFSCASSVLLLDADAAEARRPLCAASVFQPSAR